MQFAADVPGPVFAAPFRKPQRHSSRSVGDIPDVHTFQEKPERHSLRFSWACVSSPAESMFVFRYTCNRSATNRPCEAIFGNRLEKLEVPESALVRLEEAQKKADRPAA